MHCFLLPIMQNRSGVSAAKPHIFRVSIESTQNLSTFQIMSVSQALYEVFRFPLVFDSSFRSDIFCSLSNTGLYLNKSKRERTQFIDGLPVMKEICIQLFSRRIETLHFFDDNSRIDSFCCKNNNCVALCKQFGNS